MGKVQIAEIIKQIPWDEILDLTDVLMEEGFDKDAALDLAADMLDQLLPLDILLPKGGKVLEAIDWYILRAALGVVVAFAANKEKREERKERRAAKITTRMQDKIKDHVASKRTEG